MPMMYVPDDMAHQVQMQVHQRSIPQPMNRQQPMMQQPQPQSGPDWVRVANLSQVEQVTVLPGQTSWIMAQSEPVFAVRTADQVGLIHTEYYRFERFDPAAARQEVQQNAVSAENFEQLVQRVARMEERFAAEGREEIG